MALCLQRTSAGSHPVTVLEAWLLDPEGNRLLLLMQ
jgi:hypothetical protein